MNLDTAKRLGFSLLPACTAALSGRIARARSNLVTNGGFVVTGGTTSFRFGTYGGYAPTDTLAGWDVPAPPDAGPGHPKRAATRDPAAERDR